MCVNIGMIFFKNIVHFRIINFGGKKYIKRNDLLHIDKYRYDSKIGKFYIQKFWEKIT